MVGLPEPAHFQLGLDSFGEVATDGDRELSDAETVRLTVQEAKLAESVGLDVFNVGEHYREGLNDSATAVLLAALASVTERIALGTAVTVLSTNDPVRLYTEFATLHAVSNGRAQLVLGRASATESFPLFGYDLADYERLFEEKLDLFMRLQREGAVTWSGSVRPPLVAQRLHPRMPEGGYPDLDRCGRHSELRAPRRPLRVAADDGNHRRKATAIRGQRRAVSQSTQAVRKTRAANRPALARPRCRH
jgi:alkanesulfonate monooxygenase SsuD/methylene tetrahydromethanopterin reductase-like flavin-dependent oxidoreductase (luciferase family)